MMTKMKLQTLGIIVIIVAFVLSLSFSIPIPYLKGIEEERHIEAVLMEDTVVIGGNSSYYDSVWLNGSSIQESFSFTVNGTILFAREKEEWFDMWQEGRIELDWDSYALRGEVGGWYRIPESGERVYYVFFNEYRYPRLVDYQLVKVREVPMTLSQLLFVFAMTVMFIYPLITYFALKLINISIYAKAFIYIVSSSIVIGMPWIVNLV